MRRALPLIGLALMASGCIGHLQKQWTADVVAKVQLDDTMVQRMDAGVTTQAQDQSFIHHSARASLQLDVMEELAASGLWGRFANARGLYLIEMRKMRELIVSSPHSMETPNAP
jgi:hypothetical protein